MPIVRGYVRADGTPVRSYFRWAPGARREMGILAGVALAAVVLGNSGVASGSGNSPRPQSTVQYPITFDAPAMKAPRPQPTVSYPIPWVREVGAR